MRADHRPCDITIYADKGSLALRFPKRHSPLWEQLDGKSLNGKPKCLGIGKYGYRDNPEDRKRAMQLAIALEADLDHPEWEKLFDITLTKYGLGGGKYARLADVLQMPGVKEPEPEITVGEMWTAYLLWKEGVVEETTFKGDYKSLFSNLIKGLHWDKSKKQHKHLENLSIESIELSNKKEISERISLIKLYAKNKKKFVSALNEAFDYCKTKEMLRLPTANPFTAVDSKYSTPTQTTQDKYSPREVNGELKEWHEIADEKSLEEDRRAFTKEECATIIRAYYSSSNRCRFYAPLIEFYFRTGCRTSEALALTWNDIDFERRVIRFSKSLGRSTRKIKETKTGEVRLFYFQENSPLEKLLSNLRENKTSNALVFPNQKGGFINSSNVQQAWLGYSRIDKLADGTEKEYYYPGVVRQLADDGKISSYLPQYHTRHTYITLTAQANKHDNNALLYIAAACGNSVDVILKHYLGVTEKSQIVAVDI